MKKYIIILLFSYSLIFSQEIIGGVGIAGQPLMNYVTINYKPSSTLSYNGARDVMYSIIDLKDDNTLICIYTNYTITIDPSQDPRPQTNALNMNCEHAWPQSMGASGSPQKSDLHHLYPTRGNVNSSRGNKPYADINDNDTDKWWRFDYYETSIPSEFIDEFSEVDNDNEKFEPREDVKGNIARSMFYFYTMYNDAADQNFFDQQKEVLYEWHKNDPVDEIEHERTWLIAEYQENKPNPYVIDSTLVRRVWFEEDTETTSLIIVSTNGSDDLGDGSFGNPYKTIQKGIDTSSDGDTVLVSAGTYSENVNFNEKNVVVIGENRDSTFIDGGGNNRLINLLTGNNVVTLESFTIKNGYSNWGGALTFGNGDTLTLNHCNFINNVAEQGGGVFNSNGGIVDIFNCLFENNSSVNGRSVINIGNDVDDENSNIIISISHSTFNDNNSDSKGAVNVWAADSVEISNCTFSNNYSGSYAGALNVHDVNYFIMENSHVLNNRCVTGSGGGISTWDLNYGLIKNSSIIGNVSEQGNGGGMVLWSNANMEIINSTIADNQAQSAQDLFIKHNSTLKLENSVVFNRNTYDQIGLYDSFLEFDDIEQACTLTLQGTNLIKGGLPYIYKDTLSIINNIGSIILSDPLFCYPDSGNYFIAENSPAIGSGQNGNNIGALSAGCGPINPYPTINDIQNQEIFEDGSLSVNIFASSELGLELSYYAESNTLGMPVSMDSTVLTIEPQEHWNGLGIVSVFVFDTNGLHDSTSFEVTVLPINDPPTNFELIYPTVLDTIPFSVNTDETIPFTWGRSIDVDSEVLYKLTITLDYFGTSYTNEYENIVDTTYGVSAYEYAILMTNLNLPRWNIDYTIEASDGEYTIMSDEGEFVFDNTSLSIEKSIFPKEFALHQNYPNPFNPITSLRYDLPNDGYVNITIYDMMGRVVKTLVNGSQTAGFKSVQWNATNNRNEPVSAALYLYTIQAGEFRDTRKMVLLK